MSGDVEFDPADHTASEVHEYLGTVEGEEFERVVTLERSRPAGPRVTALAGLVEEPQAPAALSLRYVSGPALD